MPEFSFSFIISKIQATPNNNRANIFARWADQISVHCLILFSKVLFFLFIKSISNVERKNYKNIKTVKGIKNKILFYIACENCSQQTASAYVCMLRGIKKSIHWKKSHIHKFLNKWRLILCVFVQQRFSLLYDSFFMNGALAWTRKAQMSILHMQLACFIKNPFFLHTGKHKDSVD